MKTIVFVDTFVASTFLLSWTVKVTGALWAEAMAAQSQHNVSTVNVRFHSISPSCRFAFWAKEKPWALSRLTRAKV